MLKVALLQMSQVFKAADLMRGQDYYRLGYVLQVRLSDGLLKGRVKGDSHRIYDVYVDLKTWPNIPARCRCETQTNCRHAAACFYALQSKEGMRAEPSLTHPKEDSQTVWQADDLEWYSESQETDHHFFSYQLGVVIGQEVVSILPLVVDLLHRTDRHMLEDLPDDRLIELTLPKGDILQVHFGRIKPLLRFVLHYGSHVIRSRKHWKLPSYQLLLMQEIEQAVAASSARWHGTDVLREQFKRLNATTTLPNIPEPHDLQVPLREYQRQGLNWLQCLRSNGFGGILADDMGLGKTVQTLANLQYEKEQGRLKRASLIVAPTSLLWNWYDEAKRFTPDLKVLVFHGANRAYDTFDTYDVVISTYGLVQRDTPSFLTYDFYYLILDEAQCIKNIRNKTTQVVQQLRAKHRLCLTGTPLENHLGELWSLFHFLMPGFLGRPKFFQQFFRKPIEKEADQERRSLLIRRIHPFMLRRTKGEVAEELPPKTEIIHTLELSGSQRDLYEAVRISMEKKVRDAIAVQGERNSRFIFLDALLKLRQVCCDPRLLRLPEASMAYGTSAKLDGLLELLDNVMEEGRFVLVFSQFTSMLALIETELVKRGYSYLKLTGSTRNRRGIVHDFQAGKAPIFLISLKAGGTGLNLTRADTIIHYDPWWNPAVEEQATDRSHRIGQNKPVFVYKLIGSGTVEEAVVSMQNQKRQLFEGVLSPSETMSMTVTDAEIDAFFQALD